MKKNARSKKKNRLFVILRRILIALLALIVLLAVLLIGRRQEPRIAPLGTPAETMAMMNVISKLSSSLLTKDQKIAMVATVELTPEELNAVFANAVRAYQVKNSRPGDPVLFVQWLDGYAVADISCPLPVAGAVNIHTAVRPKLENQKLSLHIRSTRAGWLPLPGFILNSAAASELEKLESDPQYQMAMQIIKNVQVAENGNLNISFEPAKISMLIALLLQR